ncbi:carbohydrate ABC transporter permease [Thalassobacillus pellis]|uniref:carbohydrate ABC transporter permease n=1 Tax=Thalassobacillus pellis TaxID=748008 RepID=UPI001961CB67|nr:sugar ABC transporter permease [Thalassobacillus pellis]MBM7551530.1 multiple sugar transport system permease protein [Thalassobacillus pellis]
MFSRRIDKSPYGYLFIAPFFLVFFIFDLGPILYSFYLSFTDWSGFNTPTFIGLANYERLLQDTLFFKSIYNTLIIWILSIIPQLTIALTLALILHEKFIRGKHLFHAIFYFPNMVTPVTMGVLFALMFDWQNGSMNKLLMALGIVEDPVYWFNSPFLSQLIVASILMWQWFGFNMLVFLAGLQSIPEDLYEAAEIDGANKFQTAIKITLPLLRPVLIFTMITSVIGGMQIFDQPLMIGKGPENSTLTMVMHLYEAAFVRYEYGYGAAIAYGIFVLIAIATAFSMWMTKLKEKKEG